jgi:restriction endonuclease S subunit
MLSNELQNISLRNLTRHIKTGLSSYYIEDEHPDTYFVNIKDIQNGEIVSDNVDCVSVKITKQTENYRLAEGDVIISVKGPNFKAAVVRREHEGYIFSANLIALTLDAQVRPEIVAAYLNSTFGQRDLRAMSSGSAMAGLNSKTLLEVTVPVPPGEKQAAIVGYLELIRERRSLVEKEQMIFEKITDMMFREAME